MHNTIQNISLFETNSDSFQHWVRVFVNMNVSFVICVIVWTQFIMETFRIYRESGVTHGGGHWPLSALSLSPPAPVNGIFAILLWGLGWWVPSAMWKRNLAPANFYLCRYLLFCYLLHSNNISKLENASGVPHRSALVSSAECWRRSE